MAIIQHKSIPDAQLHEPKGAATAFNGQVYRSNGAGSGSWQDIPVSRVAYASLAFTGNAASLAVSAASNPSLNITSDYIAITGAAAPFVIGDNVGSSVTTGANSFIATIAGVYQIEVLGIVKSFPSATARISIKYLINSVAYGSRKYIATSPVASYQSEVYGSDLITLSPANMVQLAVASTDGGSLLFEELSFRITLVRAL